MNEPIIRLALVNYLFNEFILNTEKSRADSGKSSPFHMDGR